MEIRPVQENVPSWLPARPVQPVPARLPDRPRAGEGDHFEPRRADDEADAPFWLVAMATDRLTGRQYLDQQARREAARREPGWARALAERARPAGEAFLQAGGGFAGAAGLGACQRLTDGILAAAGPFFGPLRVVWLADKREGRGQFLFRVEGSLLQLKPGGARPESAASWLETVAHETFHHLQQELVTALYRGEPTVPGELAPLAAYYRDARAAYRPPSPAMPADVHRRQALEVGAWSFGADLARRALASTGKG